VGRQTLQLPTDILEHPLGRVGKITVSNAILRG
jgi:hypothetical protein